MGFLSSDEQPELECSAGHGNGARNDQLAFGDDAAGKLAVRGDLEVIARVDGALEDVGLVDAALFMETQNGCIMTANLPRTGNSTMKHTVKATTGKAGVLYLQQLINAHGSVFRPVHQEDDLGIDGFIELVEEEHASGWLIAVQVKSGDSYLSLDEHEFVVSVDAAHLQYWRDFMVPVILVCYSPTKDIAAWASVREYVEAKEYQGSLPVTQIRIPISRVLNVGTIGKEIRTVARIRYDERLLIKAADRCLSFDARVRRDSFRILAHHPDSKRLKITCLVARLLLLDSDLDTAKLALWVLGYGAGRRRWSWNPNNVEENEQSAYAAELCAGLTENEIQRMLELCDNEYLSGPDALVERMFDAIACCFETAERILNAVARDETAPMQRRVNAVYLIYQCDDESIEEARPELLRAPYLADVAKAMFLPDSGPA